jgi:glucokinase
VVEAAKGQKLDFDELDGAEIAEMSRNGDELAKEAVTLQHLYLVRAAKIASTALGCESILFALDNAVTNNYILHERSDRFKNEFYDFIRPEWMDPIRVFAQVKKLNFNLMGTAYVAGKLADEAK